MRRSMVFGLSVSGLILSMVAVAAIAYALPGQTKRVSVSSAGVPANASALSGVLSADGRYVVFHSNATNLVSGVAGTHVYRHDRMTGATALVDIAATGFPSTGPSLRATVSADGRYVAFDSLASDLVAGDTNGLIDVFVRDMQSTATALVSASAAGAQGDLGGSLSGLSGAHEISDDGRYVAFLSSASNLVAEPNNGVQQVYVKDMTSGAVVRASVNGAGEAGNSSSLTPAISGNGRFVAFGTASTNLSPLSNNFQVFVRDLVSGTTTLETPAAAAAGRVSTSPTLSFDGRYVAFESTARLDPRDLDNGTQDVFLRDRDSGTTVLVSLSNNAVSGATSAGPSISGDGRWVGFHSLDDLLVPVDTNGFFDVFLYDRTTDAVILVALNDADQQANMPSFGASVSSDGQLVLFGSTASNLVAPPQGVGNQLYVRNLAANQAPVLPAFGKDLVGFEGQPVRLTWEFSDNDASTSWTATVNYGDGSGTQPLALNADKTFLLDHLYAPGAYDLTVAVSDDAGATGTLVIHVVVNNLAPTVNLPSSLSFAFTRTLDASGSFTDPGSGSTETYSATVNYGDGTGAQSLVLAGGSFALHHTYAEAGTYTVAVTVSDSNGGSTTATMVVGVGGYSYEWLDPVGTSFVVGRNLPAKFRVLGPDGSPVLDQSVRVDVIDASGTVLTGPYLFGDQPSRSVMWSSDSYHVNVDTRDLAPGMYWLRVSFSSPTLTGEFSLGTTGTASSTRSRLR
jgi:hypothetical protein